ncbi:hypothetical protein Q5L94_14195, partial [Idiomarina sp. Sol25]|uniref:hypothetical protein n=1 Tax=Idiomarina sp. Sol25 TaxID=3064000 RepID=UPI00294AB082
IGEGGDPRPAAGVEILRSLGEAGDAEAAKLMATLNAAGAWMPQNWAEAFDWLERAAGLGSASARGQLTLLAEGDNWA